MSNLRKVAVEWTGRGMEFSGAGTAPSSPGVTIDGDSEAGPSPVQFLLLACASCSGSDVVHILTRMRVSFENVRVEATGERAADDPKHLRTVHLEFFVQGADVPVGKVERAVDLSLNKFCSVIHSLKETIEVTSTIAIG